MRMTPRLRSALSLVGVVLVVGGAAEAWRLWLSDRAARDVVALARPGDIVMIASDSCVYCTQARGWFNAHGVPFAECSIERDEECAARFQALMSPGTPVLLVRGRPQVGFSPERLAGALGG